MWIMVFRQVCPAVLADVSCGVFFGFARQY